MVNLPTEVDVYTDKLYQGDVVNLFTTADFRFHAIMFTGNTKKDFQIKRGFSVSKNVDIQDKKKNYYNNSDGPG